MPFSPPTHDESFFYIRYPTGAGGQQGGANRAGGHSSITEQLRRQEKSNVVGVADMAHPPPAAAVATTSTMTTPASMGQISAAVKELNLEQKHAAKVDLSKHTEPCRQYVSAVAEGEWNWTRGKREFTVD